VLREWDGSLNTKFVYKFLKEKEDRKEFTAATLTVKEKKCLTTTVETMREILRRRHRT